MEDTVEILMKHKSLHIQIYCQYKSKDGLNTDIDTSTVVIILPPHMDALAVTML
jgi:hypothetical protein